MTKKRALETLVAFTCCRVAGVTCDSCPLYEKADPTCNSVSDAEVVEAVRTLNKGKDNA